MRLTDENEKRVDEEYAKLRATFKPIFGNELHLHFLKDLERAEHDARLLAKHKEAMRSTAVYRKKTFESKLRAINQLKFIMSKESAPSKHEAY